MPTIDINKLWYMQPDANSNQQEIRYQQKKEN